MCRFQKWSSILKLWKETKQSTVRQTGLGDTLVFVTFHDFGRPLVHFYGKNSSFGICIANWLVVMDSIVLVVGKNNPATTTVLVNKLWFNLFKSTVSMKVGLYFQKRFFGVEFQSDLVYKEKLSKILENDSLFFFIWNMDWIRIRETFPSREKSLKGY